MVTCKNCKATISKNNLKVIEYNKKYKVVETSCQKCKPLELCEAGSIHHIGLKI